MLKRKLKNGINGPCIYIYRYIKREKENEKDREREREREKDRERGAYMVASQNKGTPI